MTTTEQLTPPRALSAPEPHQPSDDVVDDTLPLVDLVAVAGPPVVLLAGPLVLFALVLVGPFALLLTLVVVLAAAATVVALVGAILASPYLLVRHLRAHRAERTPKPAPVLFTTEPQAAVR